MNSARSVSLLPVSLCNDVFDQKLERWLYSGICSCQKERLLPPLYATTLLLCVLPLCIAPTHACCLWTLVAFQSYLHNKGHKRVYTFSIFLVTAEDQAELVYEGVSSGTTKDLEIFDLGSKASFTQLSQMIDGEERYIYVYTVYIYARRCRGKPHRDTGIESRIIVSLSYIIASLDLGFKLHILYQ